MQRLLRIFIGPELYWVLLYLGVCWLAVRRSLGHEQAVTASEWNWQPVMWNAPDSLR
jgi:hypothetical protein